MLKTFALACAFSLVPAAAQQPARTAEMAARELMEVTGSGKLARQFMDQMLPAFKAGAPGLPDGFWNRMMAMFSDQEIIDLVAPVYAKHLTLEELDQLLAFYRTPVGQKAIREMPQIMRECSEVGQVWGAKLGARVMEEIQAEKARMESTAPKAPKVPKPAGGKASKHH